jgi:hypothetical protein
MGANVAIGGRRGLQEARSAGRNIASQANGIAATQLTND